MTSAFSSRSAWRQVGVVVALVALFAPRLAGQLSVTISGHVTSAGSPLVGARVAIDELKIERMTDADGRYSLLVPSSEVRGQTVKITATLRNRRGVYVPKAALVVLQRGSFIQDFDLALALEGQIVAEPDSSRPNSAGSEPRPKTDFGAGDPVIAEGVGSAVDLSNALVGQAPGLIVVPSSRFGGSSLLTLRGPRSVLTPSQPLIVVDGIPIGNTVFASTAQRFGQGGFDYGSPVADFDLSSVSSLRVLSAGAASARYGSIGANGVIDLTTAIDTGKSGIRVSASHQVDHESIVRLPDFQNQYGQGLDGKFEFFNGRGAGTNDSVAQSWGPALDGRAVAQASYTTAGQGDVRLWTARPDNVHNYFQLGQTSVTTASVQGQSDAGSFSALLGYRDTRGTTPSDRLLRTTGSLRVALHPAARFDVDLSAFGGAAQRDGAPATGFTASNPVFDFTRMGRQVDTDSLRAHLRDKTGQAVSWMYTGHNNPYFSTLLNNNYSRRYHSAGQATVSYAVAPAVTATATSGVDDVRDGRLFTIGTGWLGGFPFYAGAGNFTKGGSEGDEVASQRTRSSIRVDARRALANGARWTLGAGADVTASRDRVRSLGVDSAVNVPSAGAPDTAKIPPAALWSAHSRSSSVFGETGVTFPKGVSLSGVVRNAWTSIVPGQHAATLLPAAHAVVDLQRAFSSSPPQPRSVASLSVRADLWKDASDLSPYALQTMYTGRALNGRVGPGGSSLLLADSSLKPEVTTGWQFGTDIGLRPLKLALGLTYYHEQTDGVILPIADPVLQTLLARNAGVISNRGLQGSLSAEAGDGEFGLGWDGSVVFTRNQNRVDRLVSASQAIPLAPTVLGITVAAKQGRPLGILVGTRMLRDAATGSPILKNGLPIPDSTAGAIELGVSQPRFTVGLHNTLRYRWVSASASADIHIGGELFSATNQSGSYAGTLASTAFRPDTGLLIVGIDATTRQANTTHVSTQNYFHALAAIQDPWVYSASYWRLRDVRIGVEIPTNNRSIPFQRVRVALVGRNLFLWAKAPNIDPEGIDSPYAPRGLELGQLPSVRTIGVQLSIAP